MAEKFTPKSTPTRKSSSAAKSPARSADLSGKPSWMPWVLALVVVVITGFVFSGVTKLEWTNWDDDEYVYENAMVMNGDYSAIFKEQVNNNYNPLPVAMHAWEWKQVKDIKKIEDKARLFHINNLWMHLLCTFLVFWLMMELGLDPIWAAAAALLFGIHPMRVESVAWITERKDVMFGMFYVGALLAYLQSLKGQRWLWLGLTALLFTLSLLSKIQAVSLPLTMLAIDWYKGRKWDWKLQLEKLPFFLGSFIVGFIGIYYLKVGESLDINKSFGLAERIPLGLTSYAIYVLKAIVPYETCTYYPVPKAIDALYYVGMLLALGIMAAAFFLRKISKETTFGLAFFTVNIVFLLQILGAGSAYLADRFTYIAYIGLFFALAMVGQRLTAERPNWRPVGLGILGLLIGASAILTTKYVKVWENSDTLWTDVINKYPDQVVLPYVNRGQFLRRQGENDRALADFNQAIRFQPNYHLSYLNRGNIYFDRGENDAALADYSQVIKMVAPKDTTKGRVEPAYASALSNRGGIYSRKGMHAEALADFRLALKYNKTDKNTWNNRGVTYFQLGDYKNAVADNTEYLKLDPGNALIINSRGVSYLRMQMFKEALADFDAAIKISPNEGSFYGNRAYTHASLGDLEAAKADAIKAQSLKFAVDPGFAASLGL